jgi:hypothetical protein
MGPVFCLNFLHLISYCDPGFNTSIFSCSFTRHFPLSFAQTLMWCIFIAIFCHVVIIFLLLSSDITLHLYAVLCPYMLYYTLIGPCMPQCIVSLLKSIHIECPYILCCAVVCPYILYYTLIGPCIPQCIVSLLKSLPVECSYILCCAVVCPYML